jgi:predicted metal-dependent phosphoesterase TrpH
MEKIIDLHIHTNISDGALSPKEIVDEAIKNNIHTIAIADHDTIDAYTDELYKYAKDNNINLINAVEISTKINKAGLHVLGYNFDLKNKKLIDKLSLLRNARHDYLFNVAKKLNELGYIVNTDELDKIKAVTKAHISLDIISNKENESILISNFGHIPSKGEFIETIMNENCPAYVKKESITPIEAAELIREANGKVILAHPVAYTYEDKLTDEEILCIIKEMKADGIESNYIYIDRNNNKINDIDKWNKYAKELNLTTTIGSDFHNFDNLHPVIGLINEDINLTLNDINNILYNLNN